MREGEFVLVVDDDEDARILIAEIARLAGYDSVSVGSFPEAQQALRQRPAAVLLDLVMPDQLCIRVAAYMADEAAGVPGILMSAAEPGEIARMQGKLRALGLHVAATLRKPFWVDDLLEAMSQALPNASSAHGLVDDDHGAMESQSVVGVVL